MPFRLGRLIDCDGRLQRDFKEFAQLWANVKEDWRDERCRRFEQEHLASLGPSLQRFTTALHEFCDKLRKADSELADDSESEDSIN